MKANKANKHSITLQKQVKNKVPSRVKLESWAKAALTGHRQTAEITLRIVGEDESAELNKTYRRKKGPTNVLSFPFDPPPGIKLPLLGDLVLCAPLIEKEAADQNKTLTAHWAHLVVHGTLHLLGYDHVKLKDAKVMEQMEIDILKNLGFDDPYAI